MMLAMSLALPPAQAARGDWRKVSDDAEGNQFFLDHNSVRVQGPIITYAWTVSSRQAKKIAAGTGCPVVKKVKGAIIYNASNCTENTLFKGVKTQFYNAKGELVWSELADLVQRTPTPAAPHTVFGRMHQTACQIAQPLPAVSHQPTP
jgi:hypothetical protein